MEDTGHFYSVLSHQYNSIFNIIEPSGSSSGSFIFLQLLREDNLKTTREKAHIFAGRFRTFKWSCSFIKVKSQSELFLLGFFVDKGM